jgi:signal transduction histidine kinase
MVERLLPEDLPHIFERFYRGKNAGETASAYGLACAKEHDYTHRAAVSRCKANPARAPSLTIPILSDKVQVPD